MITYKEYFNNLQEKYGLPPKGYFVEWPKGKYGLFKPPENRKAGLSIHHYAEHSFGNLNNIKVAAKLPVDLHRPELLCYCTPMEHFILHVLICVEFPERENVTNVLPLLWANAMKVTKIGRLNYDLMNILSDDKIAAGREQHQTYQKLYNFGRSLWTEFEEEVIYG